MHSKRIGIITIQGNNYGATLQAVALNHFLNSKGYVAENLDYNDLNRVRNSLSAKQRIVNDLWTKVFLRFVIGDKKNAQFESFRKENIKFSVGRWRSKESLLNNPPKYDVYMSGSDQIWNPDVMRDDYNYLLAFAPEGANKVAYASSFGKSKLPENKKDIYEKYLKEFDSIAVREKSGKAIVNELLGYEPTQVVDPTLLLDKTEWAKITKFRENSEKYVLCYYMPGDKTVTNAIKKISNDLAKKNGLKVVNLGLKEYYKFVPGMDCRVDAGPADFVNLFMGAEYVVTNSFHGTAFSTNFGKKVYVPINKDLDGTKARHIRMVDYLKIIGMESSVIPVGADGVIPDISAIQFDYDTVNANIQEMRKASVEYLVNALDNAKTPVSVRNDGMVLFDNKNECCGCTACANACPCNAITMVEDEEGFKYPEINQDLCVECGKCKAVCQIHSLKVEKEIEPVVYAAQNADDETRAKSTSGGMFSVFANKVLEEKGVIYGVRYTDDFTVVHDRAETLEEYAKFRGSKYVQSDLSDCFTQIKNDLKNGRKVLFTGTPCQIAGLKTFLGDKANSDQIVLCEIICHGAPSPKLFKDHIKLLESERGSKVVDYKNRSKVAGWHGHNEHVFFENGKNEYKTKLSQLHKDMFYAHLTIRPACYACKHTGFPRSADISIADYWGIENFMPDFDDNKGTSMLVLNTQKAVDLYNDVKENLVCRESNLKDAFFDNHKKPAKMNVNRDNFWRDYQKNGYLFVAQKYSQYTTVGRIKRQTKIILKELSKKLNIYSFIHKFTQKKYQKDTYK